MKAKLQAKGCEHDFGTSKGRCETEGEMDRRFTNAITFKNEKKTFKCYGCGETDIFPRITQMQNPRKELMLNNVHEVKVVGHNNKS